MSSLLSKWFHNDQPDQFVSIGQFPVHPWLSRMKPLPLSIPVHQLVQTAGDLSGFETIQPGEGAA